LSDKTCTDCDEITVSVTVRNTGNMAGKEIVQLYIGSEETIYKEVKKLRGFKKVHLEVGEEKTVTFTLNRQDFAYYNRETKRFEVEELDYTIYIGASSLDIRMQDTITLKSKYAATKIPERDARDCCYKHIKQQKGTFTHESFRMILDASIKPIKPCQFTLNTPLSEIKQNRIGRKLYDKASAMLESRLPEDETSKRMFTMMFEMMPLRSLVFMSEGAFKLHQAHAIIHMMNKRYFKAAMSFIFKRD
jgi:beta-glucosidase